MMKLKNIIRSVCVLGAAFTISTSANAVPVLFGGTGHYYEHIPGNTTWTAARAAALGMTNLGQSGYLATITDAAENAFLKTLATDGWIGGTDNDTDSSEGVWVWADRPEAGVNFWNGTGGGSSPTFASWGGSEPNDAGSNEDYAHYSGDTWNDLPNDNKSFGYFVEFDPPPPSTQVPEPGTLALFGLGLAGLGYMRRRRDS